MSLKDFVQSPTICALLKPLRPDVPRKLPCLMRVLPLTSNPQVLGTAFDYLLRFELQRRDKEAEAGPWVAEGARGGVGIGREALDRFPSIDALFASQDRQTRRIERVLREAKDAVATYQRKRRPTPAHVAELAPHALRLAKLDIVRRHGKLPPDFHAADPGDVQELGDLLALVPFERFVTGEPLRLNPTFGQTPRVISADADLFVGDMLVDLKTVKVESIETKALDQLIGYLILARRARAHDSTFPLINRLALYFSRHAYLWTWDVTALHDDAQFLTIERRFLDEAGEPPRVIRRGIR